MKRPNLDAAQSASAAQFDRQSDRYGRSHILANTNDISRAIEGIPDFPTAGTALDIATGGGHAALHLARMGLRVIAGDVAPRMLENARKLAHEEGFDIETNLFPAEAVPYPDASFDVVSSRIAPHHFSDQPRFVREAARLLKPGGIFLLIDGSIPDDSPETEEWLHRVEKWRDPSHGRFLSRTKWTQLVENEGLLVIKSELHPMKQPDLQWYFETAATPVENRVLVLDEIRTIPDAVKHALRLETEPDGKIIWWWPRLTLVARRALNQNESLS